MSTVMFSLSIVLAYVVIFINEHTWKAATPSHLCLHTAAGYYNKLFIIIYNANTFVSNRIVVLFTKLVELQNVCV